MEQSLQKDTKLSKWNWKWGEVAAVVVEIELFPVSMSTVKYFFSVNKNYFGFSPIGTLQSLMRVLIQLISWIFQMNCNSFLKLSFPAALVSYQDRSHPRASHCSYRGCLLEAHRWNLLVVEIDYNFRFNGTDTFDETIAIHFFRIGPQVECSGVIQGLILLPWQWLSLAHIQNS